MTQPSFQQSHTPSDCSRREFLGSALGAAATASLLGTVATAAEEPVRQPSGTVPRRKIKLGQVGCGGRGAWIAKLFQEHGGYDVVSVADYFEETANRCGDMLGVEKGRRFSGLSGYKRVLESGAEAVLLQTPTCFFPEHAAAAVEAGLHVYMAKPIAVDVPGCTAIASAGKLATQKQRVFLVDYQMPTDPINIEVARRVREEELNRLVRVTTVGICGGHSEPPREATIENRLKDLIWCNDIALGGGFILSFDIHAIDTAVWLLGKHPIAAMGLSRIARPNPHGDAHDATSVVFEYADGLIHDHFGQALPNATPGELSCTAYSPTANATLVYERKARFHRRREKPFEGEVVSLYREGARRNIAAFYEAILAGRYENETVRRAVDGTLTGILGREAASRRQRLTLDELLQENRRIEPDLTGLKV